MGGMKLDIKLREVVFPASSICGGHSVLNLQEKRSSCLGSTAFELPGTIPGKEKHDGWVNPIPGFCISCPVTCQLLS
jgi:hypothetical protein